MQETIEHFMWGFQRSFRSGVEHAAKSGLRGIGAGVDPVVVLVGFRRSDQARFDWCIEPENEPIGLVDLSEVERLAQQMFDADDESQMIISDQRLHEARLRSLRDKARARVLCTVLKASLEGDGRKYFAARSVRVGDYDVHTVIGVVASRWALLPTLATRRRDRYDVVPSLADAVVEKVLDSAVRALDRREPPEGMWGENRDDADELIRAAGDQFVALIGFLAGDWLPGGLAKNVDAVAAQPYEGRTGAGTIVFASPAALARGDVVAEVRFATPIPLSQTRAFRKVLEMSGPRLHVLCDGKEIYGLGQVATSYDPATETVFTLTVVGRGAWEIAHAGSPLLRMDNTRPSLPKARISQEQFEDTVRRLFADATDSDVADLWALAGTAAEQEHGTMLVVHRDAAAEAARLVPQALLIEPARLHDDTLRAMTNIDGAVLVSPDGLCHAVGVILDGTATGQGDSARGARYNSAVRYRQAAGDACLVIIVSEDGMINLLPDLRPRVDPARVEAAVAALEDAAAGTINFERFYRRRDHVSTLAFYLDAGQCERINRAHDLVEDTRWAQNAMRVTQTPFQVDPEMNAGYFLP